MKQMYKLSMIVILIMTLFTACSKREPANMNMGGNTKEKERA